ncbi:hypothetical protein [uncultured Algibacter sp.]|uniref:hypothetical protein n=1 Tax=uncultured Algibacter sp. TaxID=298659 RepID=UPI0032174B98
MNRKQTIQTGLIAGLLISVGLLQYRLFKANKSKTEEVQNDEPLAFAEIPTKTIRIPKKVETTPISESVTLEKLKSVFPLQLGSTGDEVTQLQVYLLKQHGWEQNVTMGTYDETTQNRVLKFLKVPQVSQALYKQLIPNPIKL